MIDTAMEGTLNTKISEVAMELFKEMTTELFKEMAMNSYQWHISRAKPSKPTYMYDVDAVIALAM